MSELDRLLQKRDEAERNYLDSRRKCTRTLAKTGTTDAEAAGLLDLLEEAIAGLAEEEGVSLSDAAQAVAAAIAEGGEEHDEDSSWSVEPDGH